MVGRWYYITCSQLRMAHLNKRIGRILSVLGVVDLLSFNQFFASRRKIIAYIVWSVWSALISLLNLRFHAI